MAGGGTCLSGGSSMEIGRGTEGGRGMDRGSRAEGALNSRQKGMGSVRATSLF
jgi:hypothetical protein